MSRALLFTFLPLSLGLFQCTPRANPLRVEMRAGEPPGAPLKEGDHASRQAHLSFTAHNSTNEPGWFMAFAVDSTQHIFWLQPLAAQDAHSAQIPASSSEPVTLGPVTLDSASPGSALITMLFSERPMPAVGVNEQVRMGGPNVVRGLEGVLQVQSFSLVLE